jgi:hypothetical protein
MATAQPLALASLDAVAVAGAAARPSAYHSYRPSPVAALADSSAVVAVLTFVVGSVAALAVAVVGLGAAVPDARTGSAPWQVVLQAIDGRVCGQVARTRCVVGSHACNTYPLDNNVTEKCKVAHFFTR